MDSSLVVALMAQELRQPVESVVIGFADPVFDERRHARAAAKHLNVNLYEHEMPVDALQTLPEIIWHYGQPFADPSMVPPIMSPSTRASMSPSCSTETAATNSLGGILGP